MPRQTIVNINDYEPIPGQDQDQDTSLFTEDIILLIVNGKRFSAHRQILASHSPVFAAMFSHDLVEAAERSVTIPDVDAAVFEKLLHFLYKGKVEKKVMDEMGVELWAAADKYQIETLKQIIEQHMCPALTTKSVTSILLLSHFYNIIRIKTKCIDHFTTHAPEIRKTDWNLLVTNGIPPLFAELYRDLAGKIRQGNLLAERQAARLEALELARAANQPGRYSSSDHAIHAYCFLGWLSLIALCIAVLVLIGFIIAHGVPLKVSYIVLCVTFVGALIGFGVCTIRGCQQ